MFGDNGTKHSQQEKGHGKRGTGVLTDRLRLTDYGLVVMAPNTRNRKKAMGDWVTGLISNCCQIWRY